MWSPCYAQDSRNIVKIDDQVEVDEMHTASAMNALHDPATTINFNISIRLLYSPDGEHEGFESCRIIFIFKKVEVYLSREDTKKSGRILRAWKIPWERSWYSH